MAHNRRRDPARRRQPRIGRPERDRAGPDPCRPDGRPARDRVAGRPPDDICRPRPALAVPVRLLPRRSRAAGLARLLADADGGPDAPRRRPPGRLVRHRPELGRWPPHRVLSVQPAARPLRLRGLHCVPGGSIVIVSTAPFIAGHRVTETTGQTFGVVVRSRGLAGNVGAGLRSLVGGEIHEYTQLREDTRRQATDRMVQNATLMGGNAVISMRFDSSELAQTMSEIVAYGTAVVVVADESAPQTRE